MLRDRDGQRLEPNEVLTIDPNRPHPFVGHDLSFRCYVCERKRRSDYHRLRGDA